MPDSPAPDRSASTPGVIQPSPTLPDASNGTDLEACEDADCEVEVRSGDRLKIDTAFGVDAITVKSVRREEIRLALTGSSGGLRIEGRNVSVKGTCVNGRCHDEGELSLTTDNPARVNEIRLRLAGADSVRAILVLLPK